MSDEVDAETEEVLNEFSFLGAEEAASAEKGGDEWPSYANNRPGDVSLGELADLTVNNEADMNMDVSSGVRRLNLTLIVAGKQSMKKTKLILFVYSCCYA